MPLHHVFTHIADAEGAELLACRQGLILAKDLQVSRVLLETDSTGVRAKLLKEEMNRSSYGPLVEELKELLRSFNLVMLQCKRFIDLLIEQLMV
jgi:ribonuclease HI